MNDAQILNWVVQGGSFALVVAVMLYLGRVLIPKTIEAFERQTAKYESMSERQEQRHERELAKRDQALERLAGSIDVLASRIERVEARTDEYRPLPPDQAKR